MKFWQEHKALRICLMLGLFVLGFVLLFAGWRMTGKLAGLGIMLVGVCCLLAVLWVYNSIYTDKPHKK